VNGLPATATGRPSAPAKVPVIAFLILLAGVLGWSAAERSQAQGPNSGVGLLLEIKGAIGPATASYVAQGIESAQQSGARILVLQMDTPGGLDSSMRSIIKAILASPVPVIGYVAPAGARAASAGTYILYASHVAAMSPATNLGAATPVSIGGLPSLPEQPGDEGKGDDSKGEGEGTPKPKNASERKSINDAAAYLRALAKLRDRNAEWAEQAVREAASLSAEEALEMGVIDLIAADYTQLLESLDGRRVSVNGTATTLKTAGIVLERQGQDWRTRLLSIITDPNIAYILMLIGIYGLIFEFSNPGFILPGVVGAIALVLALYAFQVLPINYAGLALIMLGIIFMIAEAFVPSFGALGLGGVVAFVVGSVILLDEEGYAISLPLIGGTALVSALFLLWVMGMFVRIRGRPVVTGAEQMLGSEGEAMEAFVAGKGRVWVHSEAWNARSGSEIAAGQPIRVTAVKGLSLEVQPIEEER
jgi:membrane-bound serine protease (ClpP class)